MPMQLIEVIELAGIATTVAIVLYKMNVSINVKINENTIKILQLEKEFMELKKKQKDDVTELKSDFETAFDRIRKDNREDHGKIFSTLTTVSKQIVQVSTSLQMHMKSDK